MGSGKKNKVFTSGGLEGAKKKGNRGDKPGAVPEG